MASPYQVGIDLAIAGNAPHMLALMSKSLMGMHGQVRELTAAFQVMGTAIRGAVMLFAGDRLLHGMGHIVEHGNRLVKIQRDMMQAGATNVQVQEAYARAWELTGKYTNMGAADILHLMNDARMIFGSVEAGIHHIDPFVEAGSFLRAFQGHEKGSASHASLNKELFAAMKSGEIAGKISPEEMAEHVKHLTAMKVAFGEQLKVTEYLTAQRRAGVSLRNTDDAFRYGAFAAFVQEEGQQAGTSLMTAYQKLFAGTRNTTKALELMAKLGLFQQSDLDYDKIGHVKGIHMGAHIKNYMQFATRPDLWLWETLKPILDTEVAKILKAGGKEAMMAEAYNLTGKKANSIEEAYIISRILPDRMAAKIVTEFIQQESKLRKDVRMTDLTFKSMNMPEYMRGSWDYQVMSFHTQWQNFLEAFGAPMVGTATELLRGLNSVLKDMGAWMAAHPQAAKLIGTVLSGLAVGLVAVGTIFVGSAVLGMIASVAALAAAPWLAVVAGIAALALAIYRNWPDIKAFFVNLPDLLWSWAKALPGNVKNAISYAFTQIKDMILNAINSLWEGIKSYSPISYGGSSMVPSRGNVVPIRLESQIHLDGRVLARVLSEHLAGSATFQTSVGGQDTRGTWLPPGAQVYA